MGGGREQLDVRQPPREPRDRARLATVTLRIVPAHRPSPRILRTALRALALKWPRATGARKARSPSRAGTCAWRTPGDGEDKPVYSDSDYQQATHSGPHKLDMTVFAY